MILSDERPRRTSGSCAPDTVPRFVISISGCYLREKHDEWVLDHPEHEQVQQWSVAGPRLVSWVRSGPALSSDQVSHAGGAKKLQPIASPPYLASCSPFGGHGHA